ncbi:unnamed protein product [Cyprideis torosa]|uniref:Uncharacterized protein n=1 Tax=Cyprideis torosa TaxID=163714 RepID=A0A7R8ZPK6_9CRUS|nr:unnamed protein product [Cyprideis torosa]CAG0888594.1 unnamed protein product [Cyprideis torosa]
MRASPKDPTSRHMNELIQETSHFRVPSAMPALLGMKKSTLGEKNNHLRLQHKLYPERRLQKVEENPQQRRFFFLTKKERSTEGQAIYMITDEH